MAPRLKSKLTFVIGGARSGKSAYAMALGCAQPGPRHFLATAAPVDGDMRLRIAEQRERRGNEWVTHEAGSDLTGTLTRIPARETVLVDCLTLWLTRTILSGEDDVSGAIDTLAAALDRRDGQRIVIATEVGFGIVPDDPLARAFRDHAGRMHQQVAERADAVVLVVAGLPLQVK